jgi:hypothetical protein
MGSPSPAGLSKAEHVELSEEALSILKSQERRAWLDIVTLDDS